MSESSGSSIFSCCGVSMERAILYHPFFSRPHSADRFFEVTYGLLSFGFNAIIRQGSVDKQQSVFFMLKVSETVAKDGMVLRCISTNKSRFKLVVRYISDNEVPSLVMINPTVPAVFGVFSSRLFMPFFFLVPGVFLCWLPLTHALHALPSSTFSSLYYGRVPRA